MFYIGFKNFYKFPLIFILIVAWIFSAWPSFINLSPQEVHASAYDDVLLGILGGPTYRLELDGDLTESISSNSVSGAPASYDTSIIPTDTGQSAVYNGSQETNFTNASDVNSAITYRKAVSFWLVINTFGTGTGANARNIWEEGGATNWWGVYTANNDELYISIGEASADKGNCHVAGLSTGTTYHVVMQWEAATETMELWLNGVKECTTATATGGALSGHTGDWEIGGDSDARDHTSTAIGALRFDGTIDDYAYWAEPSRLLTQSEVESIYQAGNPSYGTSQSHFRWRNDSTALNTSGGWLAVEDSNAISNIAKGTTYRLRMEVANTDSSSAEAAARTYELQWGEKHNNCSEVTTWAGLADSSSDAFEMVDSSYISSDGQSTSALLSNSEAYSFISGEGRDVADTTGSIGPMASSTYSELEYSIKATDDAITGQGYCFRLYDTTAVATLEIYDVYPEVTIDYTNVAVIDTIMEWGTQANVGDDAWTTINFGSYYNNPVVICTTEYNNNIGNESDGTPDSIVCRMQNTSATSTQVRLQETGTDVGLTGNLLDETIHWMVVEEGSYSNSEIKMEAFSYLSTVTDGKAPVNWNGQIQSYNQAYTNPVVLGQVMTTNDNAHSAFWAHDGANGAPTASNLFTGKHISEDNNQTRADEVVGVVVIEKVNNTLSGINYEANLQTQTIDRIDDAQPSSYTFTSAFSSTPSTAIISLAGVSGTDGPYPTLYGSSPLSTTAINLVVMETEIVDTEQSGNPEFVPYIVFESDGSYNTTQNLPLDQNTFRFYENINAVQPSTALAVENTAITGVDKGAVVRLRMAIQVGSGGLEPGSASFKLQYGQNSDCSAVSTWSDVGDIASSSIWRGYYNSNVNDGEQITASLLNHQNNVLQSYEAENNSTSTIALIEGGENGEWDWVLQNNGAPAFTDYCFRMVTDLGVVMEYSSYPQLTTGEVVGISLATDGAIDFDILSLSATQDTTGSGIDDVETVSIDIGPADLDIRSSHFSVGAYIWDLNSSNGSDQVKWEFASSTMDWNTFNVSSTLYSFDKNITPGSTRDIYLRLTMPSYTSSYDPYAADITIVASEP